MAQAAAKISTSVELGRGGRTARLLKAVARGWSDAYKRSRERDRLTRSLSQAEVGRQTGARC